MRVLVLTSEPISSAELRGALGDRAGADQLEVMVVAPALQQHPLKFWLSDADDAIQRADWVRRASLEQLGEEGIAASGDTGESDPLDAIQDALSTFQAERIVLFTRPESEQRYREDVDLAEVRDRFGLPVDRATVSAR